MHSCIFKTQNGIKEEDNKFIAFPFFWLVTMGDEKRHGGRAGRPVERTTSAEIVAHAIATWRCLAVLRGAALAGPRHRLREIGEE